MDLTKRLAGKTVLVTGGGSGMGKGTCQRIVAEGGAVGVADIRGALAEETAKELRLAGGQAVAVQCDVSNEAEVEAVVAETVAELGPITGLLANAGTSGKGWVHETSLEDWNYVLGVNLTGVFLSAKHCIPHMIEAGGGSIVITSSIAGSVIGAAGSAASYAVSKHAVIGLAKQIAVDYGWQGIRANAIQPSGIAGSNMPAHVAEDQSRQTTPTADLPRPKPWLPILKAGHPRDEYGATVAFLLSDDAGYITGSSIPVDGGYLAT